MPRKNKGAGQIRKILFVDDEIQILKTLTRLFFETEYEIITAESAEEALGILAVEDISLVISDMRMPAMNGYQFLSIVKQLHPKVMRVILSGYADEKIVFNALQRNIAKLYIFKPWNNEFLLKLVDQIFETEGLLQNSKLLELINSMEELPTIKSSYQRIISLIEEDRELAVIAKEIEYDQSISTKILHIANSAFFGVKTGSVRQAVTYLGLNNIKNLVQSTSIIDSLDVPEYPLAQVEKLWHHAFLTNKILNMLYERCLGLKLPEMSNSAGLLHNIGMVFLLKYFSRAYIEVSRKAELGNLDLQSLEIEHFNVTHQETGGYLLRWWELPFSIVEAALYHHQPLDERVINRELVLAVHIAQHYAILQLQGTDSAVFSEECFDLLNITREEFEAELQQMMEK